MPSVKLGLAVAWPAFWTGVPIKLVLVFLLLAMGLHPWEMPGLAFLLMLSIPVDIWALNLSGRTIFLDRLQREAPPAIGLTLWWQAALVSTVYVPVAYLIESQSIAAARAMARALLETDFLKSLPVPEQIGIELTTWGFIAVAVSLALLLGWLFLFGRIVARQVNAARPAAEPYPVLVRRWDLLRVPSDQSLFLTVFVGSGIGLVLLFWAFMPVYTPRPHELYSKEPVKVAPPLKPVEALQKTEKLIEQAEGALQALEAKAKKGKGKAAAPDKKAGAKPKKA